MTELERRRRFGMICEDCGIDVPDGAQTGMKSLTTEAGHYSLYVFYCDECAVNHPKPFKGVLV